jgi:hypothetical protein
VRDVGFGDNAHDVELREAWYAFCEQIKTAADHVFKDESGASNGERTNAFRYLTQSFSQAFDLFLENRDDRYPNLHAFCGPTRKLGADNPDCIYLQSWINDRDTFLVSGNRGTAKMFNIAVQGAWTGSLHEPFGDKPIANIFGEELKTDWNGNFELWISPERHTGNWIESKPGTRKVFYRQYFDTWDEVPATYRIERVREDEGPPSAIEPGWLIDSFERAGHFIVNSTKDWPNVLWDRHGAYSRVNAFVRHGQADDTVHEAADARRGRVIEQMNWHIETDEAVIIEFRSEPEWFWQVGACTVFGASLEFRYRQVSLTSGLSPVDSDGVTRIVLSHDDPGFANWIDIQGHTRGWLLLRNMRTRRSPDLLTKLVHRSDLDKQIGSVATRISPDERRAALHRRRVGNLRRYPI